MSISIEPKGFRLIVKPLNSDEFQTAGGITVMDLEVDRALIVEVPKELADEYDLVLFQRTKPWHGAKAGIVNDCLEQLTEEYVAIFDADFIIKPTFLIETIPYFFQYFSEK